MADNAEVLKKYGTWVVTIEGHCDERGTAEYNLALGDRRAIAAKNYMAHWASRPRGCTVSYGNEFHSIQGMRRPRGSESPRPLHADFQ
jgi:peptidoglycan-associated lipoprotein